MIVRKVSRAVGRRGAAVLVLAAVIVTGLAVHGLLPDTAATDIAGDALYAAAAYAALVVVAAPLPPLAIGGIAAAWCVGVELFQLTGLPSAWGASFAPVTLLLGTVFDARDLVVYIVTIAARIRNSSFDSDAWNASAAPWKRVWNEAGRAISFSA